MQLIHEAGYVYNDFKLGNFVYDQGQYKLLDYGNCMEYKDDQGNHCTNTK